MNAHSSLVAAGRVRDASGEIYKDGEPGEAMFVVVAGSVELRTTRRGDATPSVLRTVRSGGTFGEEALLPGLARRATAAAAAGTRVAEIAGAVARRVLARGEDAAAGGGDGGSTAGGREGRYLERGAARDVLAGSALGRDLGADELELLLDGVTLDRFARGAEIVHAGDRAANIYVVAEGLLQLQRDGAVQAYLARGDFFGDDEALAGSAYAATAVAAGDTWCAVVPRDVVRTIADRNPGVLTRWRRVAAAQLADQAALVERAGATQHVFKDLYRLQVARSLLVIDQETCVRCGHCAWSCSEVHGESRLVRRGDKVVTPVDRVLGRASATAAAATLLLPNTCQHCRHAACLHDCPTGAIGRDLDGEVFIRADACTGCGNCARSCPWDNISMADRAGGSAGGNGHASAGLSALVAVKCDLCREYAAPACVTACPTGSVLRVEPERDFAEVALALRGWGARPSATRSADRGPGPGPVSGARATAVNAGVWGLGIGVIACLVVAGWVMGRGWSAGSGGGLAAGVVGALMVVALSAYAVPKRFVRLWMKPRDRRERVRPVARSRVKALMLAHVLVGGVAPAAVLAHADGLAGTGGVLLLAFAVATVLGGFGAAVYRALPRALTRIERGGSLPEDLKGDASELRARLFKEMSGTGELVKRIADKILVPYARKPLGWIALVASGRTLSEEERRLRAQIDGVLEGRGSDRLTGLEKVIRVAVEVRALPGRRVLTASLRAWLPLHMVMAAVTLALLVVHVVMVLR
ncbi:MAG TPA: cyclic nucleotide-binding domain-containing protein [Kofleriaceae bacterium]|nr:cyclic nucleotide-binding domain-containing protein [Kofleriaceae bacterium]